MASELEVGKIGVGAAPSTYQLDVTTTGNNGIRTSNGTAQVYMGSTSGAAAIGTLNDNSLNVITNGGTRLTIDSGGAVSATGNVGVGGSPTSPSSLARYLYVGDTASAGIVLDDTNSTPWEIYNIQGSLYFAPNGTAAEVTFASSGLATFSSGINLGNTVSATATTLDGYEEGTFNLNTAGDATGVLLAQSGEYTRIGNCVHIRIAIAVGTTFTGNVLGGLPFGVYHSGDASSWATIGPVLKHSTSDLVLAGVQNGGTQVVKLWAGGNVSSAYLPNSTDQYYRFNGFYYTTDAF